MHVASPRWWNLSLASVVFAANCSEPKRDFGETRPIGDRSEPGAFVETETSVDPSPGVSLGSTGSTEGSSAPPGGTGLSTETDAISGAPVSGPTGPATPPDPDPTSPDPTSPDPTNPGSPAGGETSTLDQTGTGGAVGTESPPDVGDVNGRVIDFWGNPVPNLDIDIEGKHATTGRDGAFAIEDVAATYDVSFVVDLENPRTIYGWRFEHLTRRDPTLQVYTGLPGREATVLTTPSVELESDQVIGVGFGSGNGNSSSHIEGPTHLTPDWYGPSETIASAHGVLWRVDSDSGLPVAYLAEASSTVALVDSGSSELLLELDTTQNVETNNIGGSVMAPTDDSRSNQVYLQFQDGASIQLLDDGYPDPSEFVYLAPSLPKSVLVFAAAQGNGWGDAYAMSHKRGISAGSMDITLTIPNPPRMNRPLAGDLVSAETDFTWSLSGSNKVVVLHVEDSDYMQGLFVVTDQPSARLPTFAGFGLRKDGEHFWEIQTHLECASTDDCSGEEGFLDPLYWAEYGIAPWNRDGSFTTSGTRGFITAP